MMNSATAATTNPNAAFFADAHLPVGAAIRRYGASIARALKTLGKPVTPQWVQKQAEPFETILQFNFYAIFLRWFFAIWTVNRSGAGLLAADFNARFAALSERERERATLESILEKLGLILGEIVALAIGRRWADLEIKFLLLAEIARTGARAAHLKTIKQ